MCAHHFLSLFWIVVTTSKHDDRTGSPFFKLWHDYSIVHPLNIFIYAWLFSSSPFKHIGMAIQWFTPFDSGHDHKVTHPFSTCENYMRWYERDFYYSFTQVTWSLCNKKREKTAIARRSFPSSRHSYQSPPAPKWCGICKLAAVLREPGDNFPSVVSIRSLTMTIWSNSAMGILHFHK